MKRVVFTVIAIIIGVILGSVVNMAMISLGTTIVDQPEGVDMKDLENAIRSFDIQHFIFPFLAHALGTLAASLTAGLLLKEKKLRFIGATFMFLFFLAGGIYMVVILPSPLWFEMIDLLIAYAPMALIGYTLSNKIRKA